LNSGKRWMIYPSRSLPFGAHRPLGSDERIDEC
jgi:hypothetical protein